MSSAWVLDWVAVSVVADAGLVQPRLEQRIVFPHVGYGILKRHPDRAPGRARQWSRYQGDLSLLGIHSH